MTSEGKRYAGAAALVALAVAGLAYLGARSTPRAAALAEGAEEAASESGDPLRERLGPGEATSPPGASARAVSVEPPSAEQRERARKAREQIQEASRHWKRAAPESGQKRATGAAPAPELPPVLDRDYIQKHIREDFFPLARACYESLLAQQPKAGGTVSIFMSIAGDEEVGGVVESVELEDKSTMKDPEFLDCVRESMMSMVFEPPPEHGRVTVVYPVEFAPGERDAG
jgi:hypothetical protein